MDLKSILQNSNVSGTQMFGVQIPTVLEILKCSIGLKLLLLNVVDVTMAVFY